MVVSPGLRRHCCATALKDDSFDKMVMIVVVWPVLLLGHELDLLQQ